MPLKVNKDKVKSMVLVDTKTGKEISRFDNPTIEKECDYIEEHDSKDEEIDRAIQRIKDRADRNSTITLQNVYIDPITMAETFGGNCLFKWYEKLWIRFWSKVEYFIKTKRWIKGGWFK